MFRSVFMLFLSVCTIAANAVILMRFFRRLRKIQEDLWGRENVKPFRISFTRHRRSGIRSQESGVRSQE